MAAMIAPRRIANVDVCIVTEMRYEQKLKAGSCIVLPDSPCATAHVNLNTALLEPVTPGPCWTAVTVAQYGKDAVHSLESAVEVVHMHVGK